MANLKNDSIGILKSKLFILCIFCLLSITGCICIWPFKCKPVNNCYSKSKPRVECNSIDTIYLKHPSLPGKQYGLPIKCNQVIFNPSKDKTYDESVRNYLDSLCFEKVYSCPCEPAFELWENRTAEGNDVGVAIAGSPRGNAYDIGLLPNILMDSPEPNVNANLIDSINLGKISDCDTTHNKVKIAIIDTGIDSLISQEAYRVHLSQRLRSEHPIMWNNYHNTSLSCAPLGNRGNRNGIRFSNSIFHNSPSDYNSHGTAIHGVITGNSSINFRSNHISKLVNVKTSLGETKSSFLFDNLCAINYAAKQGAEIINLSWGFKYLVGSESVEITNGLFAAFKSVFNSHRNVLFVAAAGNDSMELTNRNLCLPASLSSIHNNLISVGAMTWFNGDALVCLFSNYAETSVNMVDVYAPGYNIVVPYKMAYTRNNLSTEGPRVLGIDGQSTLDEYNLRKSGTSLAAPYIVRLAATLKASNPRLSANELKSKIIRGASIAQNPKLNNNPLSEWIFKYVLINDPDDICNYLMQ